MAGADGDTFAIEHGADIVGVDAVEGEVVSNAAADVAAEKDQVKDVVARCGDEGQVRTGVSLTCAIGAPLYGAAAGQVTDVNPGSTGVASQPIGYAVSEVSSSSADDLEPMEVA